DDAPKLIAMEVACPELRVGGIEPVRLRLRPTALTEERVAKLKQVLDGHAGDNPVHVLLTGPDKETVLRLGDEFRCDASNGLFAELRLLFGADCIA
ncbi:MAG: hypothetical protein ACKO1Y_03400, partial [Actinomycetota bacterium]